MMYPLDTALIEQQARKLRAEEMQRISGLISARLSVYGQLLAAAARSFLAAIGNRLRPLFSWNPQAHRPN